MQAMGQRGAMFGIDARLALTIFGVLAVVAGYVAFGRIGIAKQAALLGEINALELAMANFSADMGTFYPAALNKAIDEDSANDLAALWDKSLIKPGLQERWNGPYVARESLRGREFGTWGLLYAQTANRAESCANMAECAVWLTLTDVPEARWNEVNAAYDEGGGKYPEAASQATQIGRVQADGAGSTRTLFVRLEGGPHR